jgi:hypothetical protein
MIGPAFFVGIARFSVGLDQNGWNDYNPKVILTVVGKWISIEHGKNTKFETPKKL